jgi:hypothetical protein
MVRRDGLRPFFSPSWPAGGWVDVIHAPLRVSLIEPAVIGEGPNASCAQPCRQIGEARAAFSHPLGRKSPSAAAGCRFPPNAKNR